MLLTPASRRVSVWRVFIICSFAYAGTWRLQAWSESSDVYALATLHGQELIYTTALAKVGPCPELDRYLSVCIREAL
jgi:hypothetical protein